MLPYHPPVGEEQEEAVHVPLILKLSGKGMDSFSHITLMMNNRKYRETERYCGKEAEQPQEIFLLSINEIGKDD